MRKIAVIVLASCLVLTGCAGDWQAEVRLKVTKIEEEPAQPTFPGRTDVWLDPIGELPDGAFDRENFVGKIVQPEEIDGDVKAGDEVVCIAKQRTVGALQTNTVQTELFRCRRA
ncbi:hypothetical protein SAMN04488564_104836 [Lentzea waywayandensis]|uniref:Lipoprotein n=1 Tax=Lentzea waywayandensis TaxID=84724 RepID=A0A1I6ELA6_9PSEU|nr:hypothetical protein [Lentzea waywayandensis]SFR18520.1 hypothetical protein SAMN04488564_104836 [Lentzea waywayandensis]